MTHRTDWFRDAGWGVFFHCLAGGAGGGDGSEVSADEWNRRVDAFDAERLASQLAEAGVAYGFLTIGQNSGHYCSPNATYDSFVGRRPSLCSRRDLIADVAAALGRRGIALLAYAPAHAPAADIQAIEALGCTPPWPDGGARWSFRGGFHMASDANQRLAAFQRRWEAVLREWSLRWGRSVRGWWVDGCYYADEMYRHEDEPNFASFAAALRAGNPDAIVAFNPGVFVPVKRYTEHEDYTAGELDRAFPTDIVRPPKFNMIRRWVNGAQYHVLTFMGGYWGRGEPRFGDEFVIAATREIIRREGVISWDVPTSFTAGLPDAFRRQLALLRDAKVRPFPAV